DLSKIGARLLNSHLQHQYIADLRNWYEDLSDLTPETWFSLESFLRLVREDDPGSFVLKGATSSVKERWSELMFARTRADVSAVYSRLLDRALLPDQPIYVRRYVPLVSYGTGIGGAPISKEFRFFCA